MEAKVGIFGARVGARIEPNINTGAGLRQGNLQVKVLGFGGAIGKDGLGLSTPLGGVSLEGLVEDGNIEAWQGGSFHGLQVNVEIKKKQQQGSAYS